MINQPVALVTGAGRGLGRELARRLAHCGYAVALHYRTSRDGAQALAAELVAGGHHALTFAGELEDPAQAHRLITELVEALGRVDVVVHNSGHYAPVILAELSPEDWKVGLDSTLNAAFFTTQAALPYLRERRGQLIFIGDSSCELATARDLALSYHIGKTGILMLCRSLAQAEGRYGITANCVSPGYLETSAELIPLAQIPAGRYGCADDILNAVEFLLKPASNYINGAHIVVSGGWNLR